MNKQRVKRAEKKANITNEQLPLVLWDRDPTPEEIEHYTKNHIIKVVWAESKRQQ
jgi:hypothetical protein